MSDRGIKKFNAFKSIRDQDRKLQDMKQSKERREFPELTEDQVEKVDNALMSLEGGEKIKLTVFSPYEDIVYKNVEFVSLNSTAITIKEKGETKRIALDIILNLEVY